MAAFLCPARLIQYLPWVIRYGGWHVGRLKSASSDSEFVTASNEAFCIEVLNALTASIAVLDHRGVIIAVNDAWKSFARDNGALDAAAYIGSNYLAACEAAVRVDPTAEAVCTAVRELQSGTRDQFAIEYPCHSPTEQRWFEVRMTRSAHEPNYIVVAHENITVRKQMQAELLSAKQAIETFNAQLQEALVREQCNARTDELTGINNRRQFFALAPPAFSAAVRYHHPLGAILIDLDHFKAVNDNWGHQIGDCVLKHVANIAQRHLRGADILGRYGGEEFIVLLPDSPAEQSRVVAERIRVEIESSGLDTPKGRVALTASAGVADTTQLGVDCIERLIGLADLALYAAKQAGRNRVVVYSVEPERVADGTVQPPAPVTQTRAADGLVSAAMPTGPDIKQRGLEETEVFFRAAFDDAPDPLIITNLDGTFVDVNPRASEVLGYSREELIGMHPGHILRDDDPLRLEQDLRALQEGKSYRGEWQVLRKDGSVFDGEVIGRRLPNNKMMGTVRNVTEAKRAEQARRTLEARLIQAQKVKALGMLAGGIAHDFNNILSVIIGNAEIALQELNPEHASRVSLLEIRKASLRARDLVRQILVFGREQPDDRRATQLRDLVEESVGMLRAALPSGVTLHVECEPDAPSVLVNRTQLLQVLMNLCTNAWQAMEGREGRIDISLASENLSGAAPVELPAGRYVRLSVQDNGKGMDASTLEHIFDPFYTTKKPGAGTGLGLPIVEGVVRSHHGAIRVRSEPGAGTRFDLFFPCVAADVEPASDDAPNAPRGKSQRILYLDDEEALVFLAGRFLSGLGYQVKGCKRPEEALEAFKADPAGFDLLVTDLNMPGMSGLDVASECLKVRNDLPVALASGYVTDELREKARALGIRAVIYKPNLVEDLAQSIHRLLNELA